MNNPELVQIYQFLESHHIRLSELRRIVDATLQALGSSTEFFTKFNQASEAIDIRDPMLKAIQDKLKSLAA